MTKPGVDYSVSQIQASDHYCENQIVAMHGIIQIHQTSAEIASFVNNQAIIATVLFNADRQEINHLGQCHRNHNEVYAARSNADISKNECDQHSNADCQWELHIETVDVVVSANANHISTNAQIDCMPETDHAAESQNQIQADCGDGPNHQSGKKIDVVGFIEDYNIKRYESA